MNKVYMIIENGIRNEKKLDLDTSFYKKDNLKYSLGDRGINDMYKDALSKFDGTYDEFIKLITNDEHRMYLKWEQLRCYAKQIGKL